MHGCCFSRVKKQSFLEKIFFVLLNVKDCQQTSADRSRANRLNIFDVPDMSQS